MTGLRMNGLVSEVIPLLDARGRFTIDEGIRFLCIPVIIWIFAACGIMLFQKPSSILLDEEDLCPPIPLKSRRRSISHSPQSTSSFVIHTQKILIRNFVTKSRPLLKSHYSVPCIAMYRPVEPLTNVSRPEILEEAMRGRSRMSRRRWDLGLGPVPEDIEKGIV